jgi:SAM-dependent methyltransferase
MATMSPEMEALKSRLKTVWMAGDYGRFAKYLEPDALNFLASLQIAPGTKMLDVACGAGQIAIPAARAGVNVTGIDIAANLIAQARARAESEGLHVRFEEGDAEMIPYDDESFDIVVSLIGAMFAPRPECVASEFVRVCRRGGRIVMVNWTAQGFVGDMFKVIGKHVPPPPLMPSPVKWGDEDTVKERFGDRVSDLGMTRGFYTLAFPFPPADVVECFRQFYGPTNRAFAALEGDGQAALRRELAELWTARNQSVDGGTRVQGETLRIEAVR